MLSHAQDEYQNLMMAKNQYKMQKVANPNLRLTEEEAIRQYRQNNSVSNYDLQSLHASAEQTVHRIGTDFTEAFFAFLAMLQNDKSLEKIKVLTFLLDFNQFYITNQNVKLHLNSNMITAHTTNVNKNGL